MRDGKYQLDLVLRNNITTPEHPLGVFHPHAKLHHIKKENIGLIEVMGLAVLPSRLKKELFELADALVARTPVSQYPEELQFKVETNPYFLYRPRNRKAKDAVPMQEKTMELLTVMQCLV